MKTFDFGKNWMDFSKKSLDGKSLKEAEKSVECLIGKEKVKNGSFLDIGSGSGIFSLAAKKIGATKVVGFDISENSVKTAFFNKERFAKEERIDFQKQSILESGYDKWGKFDIVYSWGVLHHTGDMWKAIKNAMILVEKDGYFVIAIYNKHWTSSTWRTIKWIYNISPVIIRKCMILFFYCLKKMFFRLINKNCLEKRRGMDFYHDVVDWVGGYPYEYASKKEMIEFFKKRNFSLIKSVDTKGWTGCNEFIFKKIK